VHQVKGFGTGKPGIAGNEGVGVVQKVGVNVKGIAPSDLVVPIKPGVGTPVGCCVALGFAETG
jgi:Zn-dependent alcohol dehydrogenase